MCTHSIFMWTPWNRAVDPWGSTWTPLGSPALASGISKQFLANLAITIKQATKVKLLIQKPKILSMIVGTCADQFLTLFSTNKYESWSQSLKSFTNAAAFERENTMSNINLQQEVKRPLSDEDVSLSIHRA